MSCEFVGMFVCSLVRKSVCLSAGQSDFRPVKNLLTLSSNVDTVGLSQSVKDENH